MRTAKVAIALRNQALASELEASLQELPVEVVFAAQEPGSPDALAASLEAAGAEVLFLELPFLRSVPDLARRIHALQSAPDVFAVHTEADPAAILYALRAGVREYLAPPLGVAVKPALERVIGQRQPRTEAATRNGKILGFVSAKGGCGATTLASHLARELPKLTNSKALLADCDFDAGLIAFLFKTKSAYSLADAAMNVHRLDASYWDAVVSDAIPGLHLIGAPPMGGNAQVFTPDRLHKVFRFFRTQYDWVLADTGRGFNPFRLSVLSLCDEVYLVTTAEITALHYAQKMISSLANNGCRAERLRVLLNRPPKQLDITVQELEKMLGAEIFGKVPNDDETLNESYAQGALAPGGSAIGRAVIDIGRRIAGVPVERAKKRFSLFN